MLKRNEAPWLHTTDVVSLSNAPFTHNNGWSRERADIFLNNCVDVVDNHVTIPDKRPGLIPYVFTVVLADFIRASKENPAVPKDANGFCAVESIFRAMKQGEHLGANFFHFVFDQNEPFRGHLIDRMNSKKARRDAGIYHKITSNTEANMRCVPGLQVTDLIGWCISNKNRKRRRGWHNRILRYRKWIDDWNGYERIMQSNPEISKKIRSWNLPKRKDTS